MVNVAQVTSFVKVQTRLTITIIETSEKPKKKCINVIEEDLLNIEIYA